MKPNKKFSGVVIPTVTPLTPELKLDVESLEKMFNNLSKNNADPFIIGTTGEAASLPLKIKKNFIQEAVKLKKPGTKIYAGIASNVLEESIELARYSFDNGVDVVAANLPSYYILSNDQVKRYFENLADAIPGPLIIYNIPVTTHMSIPLDIIDDLSYHERIVGTKDSERSEERLTESLKLWANREDFSHFLGWAGRSAHAMINGCDGLIPSTGNLYPKLYKKLTEAVEAGDHSTASDLQRLSDVLGDLYQQGRTLGESLWALKVLMTDGGLCQEYVMPPLQPMGAEEESRLLSRFNETIEKEAIYLN